MAGRGQRLTQIVFPLLVDVQDFFDIVNSHLGRAAHVGLSWIKEGKELFITPGFNALNISASSLTSLLYVHGEFEAEMVEMHKISTNSKN